MKATLEPDRAAGWTTSRPSRSRDGRRRAWRDARAATASMTSGARERRTTGALAGSGRRADDRPSRSAGSSRSASSARPAAGSTSAWRAAGSSASAAAPATASTMAGSARRGFTAGRPTPAADRLTHAADPARRPPRARDLGRGDGPDRRALEGRDRALRAGIARLLQLRPAVPRGVLHARARRARPASAPRTSTATPGCAPRPRRSPLIESFGTDGAPGSLHRLRRHRRDLPGRPQHGLDPDGALGARPRPARRPDRRRSSSSSTRAGRRPPSAPTSTSRRDPGTNLPLLNGLLRIILERGWIDSDFIRDHTVDFETLVSSTEPWTPDARGARHRRPARRSLEAAAEILGHLADARVDVPPGRLPVAPGHRQRRPGEQPAPDPRPDRQARLDRLPDERPAHRPEHARMRRQRRVHRLPQLEQPRPRRRRRRRSGTSSRRSCRPGRRRPTRCRSSSSPRRARSGSSGSSRTNPAVSLPGARPDPPDPREGETCSSSSRTRS